MSRRVLITVTARPALDVIAGHVDALVRAGWQVHVVVGEPFNFDMFPYAETHVLPMKRNFNPFHDLTALRAWGRLLEQVQPDVLVGATPKASLLAITAAAMADIPHRIWWVWGIRGERMKSSALRRIEATTARAATMSVAASESLADVVVAAGAPQRPRVLGHGAIAGVDTDVFCPADEMPSDTTPRPDCAERTAGKPTAIYVGRLAKDKGMAELAEVWREVAQNLPEAQLLVVGAVDPCDKPGDALPKLANLPGVHLLGYRDDIADLLRCADVMIFPSIREGLPGVVIEAAAAGVPTVAWDVTGVRDAIDHNQTGLLLPQGDITHMAQAATRLLRDAEERKRMGRAARERATHNFDRTLVEAAFAQLLDELVPATTALVAQHAGPQLDLTRDPVIDLTQAQTSTQSGWPHFTR